MKMNKKLIIQMIILIFIDEIIKIAILIMNININFNDFIMIKIDELVRANDNLIYFLMSFIIITILYRYIKSNNSYIKNENRVIVIFAISGVICNFIDRIWKGCVINYFYITDSFCINLGYIYILIAWIGMAAILTKNTTNQIKKKKGSK